MQGQKEGDVPQDGFGAFLCGLWILRLQLPTPSKSCWLDACKLWSCERYLKEDKSSDMHLSMYGGLVSFGEMCLRISAMFSEMTAGHPCPWVRRDRWQPWSTRKQPCSGHEKHLDQGTAGWDQDCRAKG